VRSTNKEDGTGQKANKKKDKYDVSPEQLPIRPGKEKASTETCSWEQGPKEITKTTEGEKRMGQKKRTKESEEISGRMSQSGSCAFRGRRKESWSKFAHVGVGKDET